MPCEAHTLNLVVSDAAKNSTDATGCFCYLQKFFTLFSTSTQRWGTLKRHVNLYLESWSYIRRENRVSSLETMRYQCAEVIETLIEVRDKASDLITKTETQSLAEEVGS